VKSDYLDKNKNKLETYLHVLQEAARQRDFDFEKALSQLQPIYNVPKPILAEGLKRQTPQPVLDTTGLQSLHNGVGYLIELGYLKSDVIDRVFDPSVQQGARLAAA
jgi:NitT/TauT family transport system substrate-binding protein